MANLKLIALDVEDLAVLSAHVQDAVVRVDDLAYVPQDRRLAMVINRFDWTGTPTSGSRDRDGTFVRARSGLRFEKVTSAKVSGINLADKSKVLSLMAVTFSATEDPSGVIQLVFSGDAAIRLEVECIEAELRDLGAKWSTKTKPSHPDEN